jgi:hypothetical protein
VKQEENAPISTHRHRWECNIKIDTWGTGWGSGDWIDLAQERDQRKVLLNTVMDFGLHEILVNS